MIGARKLAVLVLGTLLAGACAPTAQQPRSAATPPGSTRDEIPVPRPTEPLHEPERTVVASVDSMPTPDAIRVLATIPEPIPASQFVPPPFVTRHAPAVASDTLRAGGMVSRPAPGAMFDSLRTDTHRSALAPASSFDTLRAESEGIVTDSANVPVPAPTEPLGQHGGTLTMPESLSVAPPETTAATTPSQPEATTTPATPLEATTVIPSQPLADGSCWRVQIAAPAELAEAESRRDAARSLLVARMVIEPANNLYKVRSEGCLTREAADALRKRAVDSGFEGAFVVNTGAQVPDQPAAHKATAKPPAKKAPVHRATAKRKPVKR